MQQIFSLNSRIIQKGKQESAKTNTVGFESFLSLLLQLFVNLKRNSLHYSPDASAIQVVACREDSLSQDVCHLPEKCRADPDLFEKVYCGMPDIRYGKIYPSIRHSLQICR